jgi:hypothetical protein
LEYDAQGRMADLEHKKKAAETSSESKSKPEGKKEARKVVFERGPDGRITGASIN